MAKTTVSLDIKPGTILANRYVVGEQLFHFLFSLWAAAVILPCFLALQLSDLLLNQCLLLDFLVALLGCCVGVAELHYPHSQLLLVDHLPSLF